MQTLCEHYVPSVHTQARSFCRGLLARAVDPSIRSRLMTRLEANAEEVSHLRSFLDLGSRQRGWRKTNQGSGKFAWKPHVNNSVNRDLRDIARLRRGADLYFLNCPIFPRRMLLSPKVTLIYTKVSINGTDWHVQKICEYIGYIHTTHANIF
jgi:hypothetical protein